MYADGLTHELVFETIMNTTAITKTLRSRSPRSGRRETLCVINNLTYDSLTIYTKGKFAKDEGWEESYVLISSKRSTDE